MRPPHLHTLLPASLHQCGRAVLLLFLAFSLCARADLSLEAAVAMAQENDPWLAGSRHRQQALEAQSVAAGTLPDPVMSVGFANLPTDTFAFDQEAMTQLQLGVTQVLPRGNSTELSKKQLALLGSQHPHLRNDRRAMVAVTVSLLWLDTYKAAETVRLIEADRELFEHLVDVAQSSYASAMGKTRQQDLIRAQLELTRLEDRLTVLDERLETSRSRLGVWLQSGAGNGVDSMGAAGGRGPRVSATLPDIALTDPQLVSGDHEPTPGEIAGYLLSHPSILGIEARIDAGDASVELARQKYKPEWKVSAGYGYRDDAPSGMDRADFFSVGIAFDLPLFTANRQDQQLQSAVASTEATRTERALALRQLEAGFTAQRARLLRLEQRRVLYRTRLLAEMHEQAEASLAAYTHDDGDFAEVVRARIAELNARIEELDIEIERLKTIVQLNYYLVRGDT